MSLRRPEQLVLGPRPAQYEDVDPLNRVFAEAFTDRYRRDGMVGVRVPRLNPQIWRYAIDDAGSGAMLWSDEHNDIVAFNIAHHSGAEGWMGPLAVRSDRQGLGLGTTLVRSAVEWLRGRGVSTIGLETMPRTVDNIGFYSRLGFTPGHLTVTMVGDAGSANAPPGMVRLSQVSSTDRDALVAACRDRLHASAPGYDFTREIQLTQELQIGDALVLDEGGVRGFALWHSAALVEGRPAEELRLLKLFADEPSSFHALVTALEECATREGLRRVAVRCQSRYSRAYAILVRDGYRVRWTDLRMALEGYPEATLPDREVLLSNWEV